MVAYRHHDAVARLIRVALDAGGVQHSMVYYSWNVAGNCERPHVVEFAGRPRDEGYKTVAIERGRKATLYLEMHTRCRACSACLNARRRLWVGRAVAEVKAASRTWFGSLTYKPQEHVRMLAHLRHTSASDFDALASAEQFRLLAQVSGADLTLWLKRVRKISRAPLRYLAVAERHKSGMVHWHLLVHELDAAKPVRHALLKGQWASRHGYCDWKLVDDTSTGSARYVAKYLGKSIEARVRASLDYGTPPSGIVQREK